MSVEEAVKLASKSVQDLAKLPDKDQELFGVNCMRFKDAKDIYDRFPYPDELEEEDGIFSWRGKVVVSKDMADGILQAMWTETGVGSLGSDKFHSKLQHMFWCVSSPMVTSFLKTNEEASVHRQRRRSQVTKAFVPPRPGARVFVDCTDVNKFGLKTLFNSFSKVICAIHISVKTSARVAKAMEECIPQIAGGKISQCLGDGGSEFIGEEFQEVLAKHGTSGSKLSRTRLLPTHFWSAATESSRRTSLAHMTRGGQMVRMPPACKHWRRPLTYTTPPRSIFLGTALCS
jgi:hypothetical protein